MAVNDPYLVALPPVPCLALQTTMDIKPDGYFERPVTAVGVLPYMGSDGVTGARGRDGKSGHRQPGENAAHGQHGTPAESGRFIDAHIVGLSPTNPESGLQVLIKGAKTDIALPAPTAVDDSLAVISVRGGHGGSGGSGGSGGHGDMGTGDGGRGGAGGAAGHGGYCRVTTQNPYLLMLLRVDTRPGIPGSGGNGGNGGSGGSGGAGGPCGEYGGVEYAILSPDGGVMEESVTPYHLQLLSYDIIDDMADNIFEPGEWVTITNVQVMNAGGLTLPHGSKFQFCNTDSITFEPHDLTLGALAPGAACVIPHAFRAQIHDIPEPIAPGAFHGVAKFPSSSHLLNRQFQQGSIWSKMHTQWPVVISKMAYPRQLGRGDTAELRVGIKNVSTRAYGVDAATAITIRIHSHALMPPTIPGFEAGPNGSHFYDFAVANLEAGTEQIVALPIQMQQVGPELFDRLGWHAEVILRSKKIEFDTAVIRVSPKWEEYVDVNADIVLFCGHHWSRNEYLVWMDLLKLMGVEAQLWDFDYYRGISFDMSTKKRHPESWVSPYIGDKASGTAHNKTLVFSVAESKQLQTLVMDDVYKHFMSFPTLHELTLSTPALDEHGALILGIDNRESRNQIMWSSSDLDLTRHFKDSFWVSSPDEKDAKAMANSLLKKLNASEFYHKISTLKIQPAKESGRNWTFGELRAKRCCFRKNSRLFTLENPIVGLLDQQGLPPKMLDINSHFGQMFFNLVAVLPLKTRLQMIMKAPCFSDDWKVIRRSSDEYAKVEATLMDFMMLLAYNEVRNDFVLKDKQRPRLEALTVLIESDPDTYKHENVLTLVLYVFKRAHKKAKIGDKSAEKRKDRVKNAVWGKNYKKDPIYTDYDKRATKAIDAHAKKIKLDAFLTNVNGAMIYDMKD